MKLPLTLRHGNERRPARAWMVPGTDARAWLDELLGFDFDWLRVSMLPVAADLTVRGDRQAVGVLVIAPPGVVPRRVLRARPYQLRADSIWLPVDSELFPPVDDTELQQLADGRHLVFHPSAGVVAFMPHEVGSLLDLLSASPARGRWDRARPGLSVTGAITEVIAEVEPQIDQLFVQESTDIGREPPSRLPPLPGERDRGGLQRLPGAQGMLASLILRLTRNVPRTAAQSTWIDRLEAWARRHMRPSSGFVDQGKRERELQRLLRLLQDDPSQGLRFALPIGGDAGRGLSLPSNRLDARITDFDIRRLGGGEPVDDWQVPPHQLWQLRQIYHELANAEIEAGRHRRAAYIFAHLLGDLRAAAGALAAGRSYREAALLYRERLDDPQAAAKCLVDGGLLVDAAKMEEELGNWERAGDLWLILGQAAKAEARYLQQWQRLFQDEQWLQAAMLRAEKLCDVDGALELLADRAWQGGDHHAFAAWLALAERDGRCGEVLRSLGDEGPPIEPTALAEVIGAFGARADPGELRDAARSRVRVIVSEVLGRATPADQRRLLRAMRATSPDDRVLAHDLRQAALRLAHEHERVVTPADTIGPISLRRLSQRLTPKAVRWTSVATTDSALWLTGEEQDTGCFPVLRLPWSSDNESQRLPQSEQQLQRAGQLEPARGEEAVWLRTTRPGPVAPQWLKRIEHSGDRLRHVESASSSIESACCTFAVDDDGAIWRISTDVGVVLHHESRDRRLLATHALPRSVQTGDEAPIMVALHGHLVMAFGHLLVLRKQDGTILLRQLDSPVHTIVRSEEGSNPVVLIGLDEGLHALHVFAGDLDRMPVLARGLSKPTLGWSRSGVAIAVDRRAVWLARTRNHALADPPLQTYTHGQPSAIRPTPQPAEIVLLSQATVTRVKIVG